MKWFCLLFALVFAGLANGVENDSSYVVEISEEQVRDELDGRIPIIASKLGAKVKIINALVDFKHDGSIDIEAGFESSGYGVTGEGALVVNSRVVYQKGDFYLTDVKVREFEHAFHDKEQVDNIKKAAKGILKKFASKLTVDDDMGSREAIDKLSKKYTPLIKEKVVGGLKEKLVATPIYSLKGKGLKYDIAAAALQKIEIQENGFKVYLSVSTISWVVVSAMFVPILFILALVFGNRR